MKLNNDIIIKKYSDKYAAKVADMWNKSSGGWNGEEFNETEEKIISKHKSMTYLDVYLALYENDVVGYCMISEDNLEENVLYIDLLNVRTDMHGKRVGKPLLLK